MPKGLWDLAKTPFEWVKNKEVFEEMKKYSLINGYKRFVGGAASRSIGEIYEYGKFRPLILGDALPLWDKIKSGKWLTAGIRQFDAVTVASLWKGIKTWVESERPGLTDYDSKMKKVAQIYDYIVERNQPTFMPYTRGEITTTREPLLRGLTMFFSQKNKILNELAHIPVDIARGVKEGNATEAIAQGLWSLLIFGIVGPMLIGQRDELRDWFKMRPRDVNKWFDYIAKYTLSTWPIGGDILVAIMNKRQYGTYTQRGEITSVIFDYANDLTTGFAEIREGLKQRENDPLYRSGLDEGEDKWTKTVIRGAMKWLPIAELIMKFPLMNAYDLYKDINRRMSPEKQFALDHMTRARNSTYQYQDLWSFVKTDDKKMIERQLYILMDPNMYGRDYKGLEQSFKSYYDKGELTDEHWKIVSDIYNKLAKEHGWVPDRKKADKYPTQWNLDADEGTTTWHDKQEEKKEKKQDKYPTKWNFQ